MDLKKVTNIGILSALSLLMMIFIKFPIIPAAPFLLYEPGDLPILIIGFIYGPIAGITASLLLSILMAVFVGLGGPFGAFMHFLATGTLVATASYIYKKRHNQKGAIIGLLAGSIVMTVIMVIANIILNPIFYGIPQEEVLKLLVPAIIPFNIMKAFINSGLTLLVYKRLANFLRERGLMYSSVNN